jgi:DNA-binding response OmpR family regulator
VLLRFGVFELDPAALELRRAGVLVKLSPQQLRVLHLLADRSGQVCTREEIQREIWGTEVYVISTVRSTSAWPRYGRR